MWIVLFHCCKKEYKYLCICLENSGRIAIHFCCSCFWVMGLIYIFVCVCTKSSQSYRTVQPMDYSPPDNPLSIFAWEIPWTVESGGLQSTGWQELDTTHTQISSLYYFLFFGVYLRASLVAQRVKHLPAMWETQVQSLGWEDLLEKEMATHSSILAWRIPWMEEPSRLQSMGS